MLTKFINIICTVFRKLTARNNRRSIGIIAFKFLGDTVFTVPAIDLLKNNYKDYDINLYCYHDNEAIYKLYFNNINYYTYNKEDWDVENRRFNFHFFRGIKEVRKNKNQILVDLSGNYKTALICLFSGSGKTVGFGNKVLASFYDHFMIKKSNIHQMDMFIEPLKDILIKCIPKKEFEVRLSRVKKILINPFAGWRAKEWNFNKFIELAYILSRNYQVVFIAKKGMMPLDSIEQLSVKGINTIQAENINKLIEAIGEADLILSNDTGTIYIAALVGKPTFTIFGPTNPGLHKPYGMWHKYINKKIICSPGVNDKMCFTFGGRNGCPSFECMNQLTVQEVLNSLDSFIVEINNSCDDIYLTADK